MNLLRFPHSRKALSWLTVTVSFTILLSGCGILSATSSTVKDTTIKVVAAENFYGELAAAVGGDRVEVTSILDNPDADPHAYEPTTDNSKAVNDAQVIIYNGIGYDVWMDKLMKASSRVKSQSVIIVGSDLLGKQDGDNPHVWYDPAAMPKLADALADKLGKIDPKQADAFKTRAQAYKASLSPINELITSMKQTTITKIAVSEPVFDYMAISLNLEPIDPKFAKSIEEGTDPSPVEIANLQNAISGKTIKLFIENIQTDSPTVKNMAELAKANHIPIVQVTETKPSGKSYVQWMTDQLNQLKAIFTAQ
jgi:zinc/manganese transport system substrate-binding protein